MLERLPAVIDNLPEGVLVFLLGLVLVHGNTLTSIAMRTPPPPV